MSDFNKCHDGIAFISHQLSLVIKTKRLLYPLANRLSGALIQSAACTSSDPASETYRRRICKSTWPEPSFSDPDHSPWPTSSASRHFSAAIESSAGHAPSLTVRSPTEPSRKTTSV